AYRFAYESVMDRQDAGDVQSRAASPDAPDLAAREQMAREAGRRAQISAVKHLLQIQIDHFVEITLGAFFQIARVVEPIAVCLNEDTSDRFYSGADFHKGVQRINATQTMHCSPTSIERVASRRSWPQWSPPCAAAVRCRAPASCMTY